MIKQVIKFSKSDYYELDDVINQLEEINKEAQYSVIDDCIGDLICIRQTLADELLAEHFRQEHENFMRKQFPEQYGGENDSNN